MRTVVSLFVLLVCPAQAATVTVIGDQVILSGKIDNSEFAQLRDVAQAHGAKITTVVLRDLTSNWESYESARHAAGVIREHRWRTAVSGACSGGCAFIFLGGVARHFTDDKPAKSTHVTFAGTYYGDDKQRRGYGKGEFSPIGAHLEREWVKQATEKKIGESVLDEFMPRRWEKERIVVSFFDPVRLKRADGLSVFACNTGARGGWNWNDCRKLATDAYKEGIVTSSELVRSNDRATATRGGSATGPAPTPPGPGK